MSQEYDWRRHRRCAECGVLVPRPKSIDDGAKSKFINGSFVCDECWAGYPPVNFETRFLLNAADCEIVRHFPYEFTLILALHQIALEALCERPTVTNA